MAYKNRKNNNLLYLEETKGSISKCCDRPTKVVIKRRSSPENCNPARCDGSRQPDLLGRNVVHYCNRNHLIKDSKEIIEKT